MEKMCVSVVIWDCDDTVPHKSDSVCMGKTKNQQRSTDSEV